MVCRGRIKIKGKTNYYAGQKSIYAKLEQKYLSKMTRKGNQPWENYVNGYPSLSSFIASDQDQSTYIFRKFKRTTARNLLYLEAELSELEAQQDKYDEEDLRNGDLDTAKRWARSWPEFSSLQNSSSPNPYQIDRLELVYKMRKLQKEYRE